jgi:polysaccharide export outer membrane protein
MRRINSVQLLRMSLVLPAAALALSAALFAQAVPAQTPPAALACGTGTSSEYALHMSDELDIKFPFAVDYNETVTVQPDGQVSLREARPVFVEGKTIRDAEAAIAAAYTGTLKDPSVSIILKDFQKPSFYASGEIGKPGQYEIRTPLSLMQAITIAGGINNDRARKKQIIILRPQCDGNYLSIVYNIKNLLAARATGEEDKLNFIQPGDIIYVPQNRYSKIQKYIPSANIGAYLTSGIV